MARVDRCLEISHPEGKSTMCTARRSIYTDIWGESHQPRKDPLTPAERRRISRSKKQTKGLRVIEFAIVITDWLEGQVGSFQGKSLERRISERERVEDLVADEDHGWAIQWDRVSEEHRREVSRHQRVCSFETTLQWDIEDIHQGEVALAIGHGGQSSTEHLQVEGLVWGQTQWNEGRLSEM